MGDSICTPPVTLCMKDDRTETWNPYTMPAQPQTPDWQRPAPDTTPMEGPVRFEPRGNWIDRAGFVRPR
jgi:hypothetical protein